MQTGTGRDIVVRPANEYVAEFVRHVNPRTAIKGGGAAIAPTEPPKGRVAAMSPGFKSVAGRSLTLVSPAGG